MQPAAAAPSSTPQTAAAQEKAELLAVAAAELKSVKPGRVRFPRAAGALALSPVVHARALCRSRRSSAACRDWWAVRTTARMRAQH